MPTNASTITSAFFKQRNFAGGAASAKYSERSPRIAMMFDVKTRERIERHRKNRRDAVHGKRTSELSMTMSARGGVAKTLPSIFAKKSCPCISCVTGRNFFAMRSTTFFRVHVIVFLGELHFERSENEERAEQIHDPVEL